MTRLLFTLRSKQVYSYQYITTLEHCSGRVLGPYGGTGGIPFDTGDLGHRGCYLGYISGRADRRVDQLIIHWTCPKEEKQYSMVEAIPYTGCGDRVLLDLLLVTFLVISLQFI